MMEYFVVYDAATGEPRWRGSGPAGSSAMQRLDDGLAILIVPQSVIASEDLDLDALRTALSIGVDNMAEQVRSRFVTALPAQIGTYVLKEAAARAWLADNTASTVMLAPEAQAREMTIGDLAAEVIANADAWTRLSGAIEGIRFAAKRQIAAGANIGQIAQAALVDWSAVVA